MKDAIDRLNELKNGAKVTKLKTLSPEQLCKMYHVKYDEKDSVLHSKLQLQYLKETLEELQ